MPSLSSKSRFNLKNIKGGAGVGAGAGFSSKIFQNRFVLYLVLFLAVTNVLGYLAVNNWKAITYFIVISLIANTLTKNMIIILGSAILITNLLVARRNMLGLRFLRREGMTSKDGADADVDEDVSADKDGKKTKNNKHTNSVVGKEGLKRKTEGMSMDKKKYLKEREMEEEEMEGMTTSAQKSKQQGFGQRNVPSSQPASANSSDDSDNADDDNGIGKRIDYASTLEQAYDNLQNVLGNDGMGGLTKETQQLIKQQKSLMETMKTIQPMMKMAKETMSGFDMKGLNQTLDQVKSMMGSLKG
jgi:hypothetical protein